MAKKSLKVRRRKNSNFGPGMPTVILYVLAGGVFWGLYGNVGDRISEIYSFLTQGELGLVVLCVAGLVGAVAFYVAPYAYGSNRIATAQLRRDEAVDLMGTYALLLRPFYWDERTSFPNPFKYYSVPGFEEGEKFGPEAFVGRVLEPYIDVVQVGGGLYRDGNGRLPVRDESWQDGVISAIRGAAAVVILPTADRDEETGQIRGQGTIWELNHLVNTGHIDRTLALMPKNAAAGWEQARLAAAEFGLRLPTYNEKGCVVTFEQVSGVWQAAAVFGEDDLAAGLVGALEWMAERHGFQVLDRY